MCRNQSEVTTILNSCGNLDEGSEDELDQQAFEEGIPNLARLRLAVNYNQKQVGPQALTAHNKKSGIFIYACIWLIIGHFFCTAVCSPPNLPAGALLHLVWEPFRLEGQQNSMEASGVFGDLPDHAYPLPNLLDRTKVKGWPNI